MTLVVPDLVRQRAMSEGDEGRRWLDALPDRLTAIVGRWQLHLGEVLHGGTAALVVGALDPDGREVVVKVAIALRPDEIEAFDHSVIVHRLAAGRGCVELLDVDETERVLLLERLGPNLDDLATPVGETLGIIADTLREFWRPVPLDCGLWTGADKAEWLADYIVTTWSSLDQPCHRAVIDRALDYCSDRTAAFDPADAVLVHGDAHGWNTVVAGEGHKFVDPEGLIGERAHDLSVPMREYNAPLLDGDTMALTRARADFLAERCSVDPEAVWQWGFIERVSTGLANLSHFDNGEGRAFLDVAERCL